ncbi:MAG: PA2817 family protein [Halieaceae bacterium]|jgi:hypothetical protein|nr:PA2817 family protein [Halieaceae bacterium]
MDDTAFHNEQMAQFVAFAQRLQVLAAAPGGEPLVSAAEAISEIAAAETPRIMDEAPFLVARLLTTAPQLAEQLPRDLLWYLGGDCLHFMPDEEIGTLTRLDERRREAVAAGIDFNWREERARALKLQ